MEENQIIFMKHLTYIPQKTNNNPIANIQADTKALVASYGSAINWRCLFLLFHSTKPTPIGDHQYGNKYCKRRKMPLITLYLQTDLISSMLGVDFIDLSSRGSTKLVI